MMDQQNGNTNTDVNTALKTIFDTYGNIKGMSLHYLYPNVHVVIHVSPTMGIVYTRITGTD